MEHHLRSAQGEHAPRLRKALVIADLQSERHALEVDHGERTARRIALAVGGGELGLHVLRMHFSLAGDEKQRVGQAAIRCAARGTHRRRHPGLACHLLDPEEALLYRVAIQIRRVVEIHAEVAAHRALGEKDDGHSQLAASPQKGSDLLNVFAYVITHAHLAQRHAQHPFWHLTLPAPF